MNTYLEYNEDRTIYQFAFDFVYAIFKHRAGPYKKLAKQIQLPDLVQNTQIEITAKVLKKNQVQWSITQR